MHSDCKNVIHSTMYKDTNTSRYIGQMWSNVVTQKHWQVEEHCLSCLQTQVISSTLQSTYKCTQSQPRKPLSEHSKLSQPLICASQMLRLELTYIHSVHFHWSMHKSWINIGKFICQSAEGCGLQINTKITEEKCWGWLDTGPSRT